MSLLGVTTLTLTLMIAGPAIAAEKATYTYDAKGRLGKVVRSGSINNGLVVDYTHDKSNNRTNLSATGAAVKAPTQN